jgi:hypothetical protein
MVEALHYGEKTLEKLVADVLGKDAVSLGQEFFQPEQFIGGDPEGGVANGQGFQGLPDGHGVGQFVGGDAADPVSLHGNPLDVAVGLELLYGFPDRCAAHAELFGDFAVGEGGVGLEFAPDDGLAEVFIDDVPHGFGAEIR